MNNLNAEMMKLKKTATETKKINEKINKPAKHNSKNGKLVSAANRDQQ